MRRKDLYTGFLKLIPGILLFITVVSGCRGKTEFLKSPPGYDFSKVETKKLDLELREISGIAWDHVKNEFAAIKDERGRVYFLDKESKAIRQKKDFAGKGDFEDIAYVNTVPYILKSDGSITKCNMDSAGNASGTEIGKLNLKGSKDFESMYYDPNRKALIIICKNCGIDKKASVSAFAFYLDSTGFDTSPVYQIDLAAVESLSPKESSRFQPSGAAIHPLQNKLYILSSASNQLVITDLNGTVEKVFALIPSLFPQPEGICFKRSGEMFITNEGGTGKASLLRFIQVNKATP